MERFILETLFLTGIQLMPEQITQFLVFDKELLEWNNKFNLTAIREPKDIWVKHFLDSLSIAPTILQQRTGSLVDVGTGAGFPGIPLKIIFPAVNITLVESVRKKAEFCQHIINKLSLSRIVVITSRAEDLGQSPLHREKYDWATARAVASMPVLMEYLLPLVNIGGIAIAQKGGNAHAETQSAENVIHLLGGRLNKITPVILPGVVEERFLVFIDKRVATPAQYPRRAGLPSKKPLS